jgi:hypothetical protein
MGRVVCPPLVGTALHTLQALVDVLHPPVAGHYGGYGGDLHHGQYGGHRPYLSPIGHVN